MPLPTTTKELLRSADLATELALRWFPHGYASHCSRGAFKVYPHVEFIGRLIGDRVRAGRARLIITMPPRHSKSETVSAWVPPWFLDWFPHKRVMLCSYAASLADDYGRRIRNEVRDNDRIWFSLREDSTAANRWHTPQGGGMVTSGVDGSITGRGYDLGIIDDPIKNWAEAKSSTVRRACIDWYHSTFSTRAEPNASIVIVTTRWDPGDLVGYLLEHDSEQWEHVRLPAIAEAGDPLGRKPGEALCPERYTVADLEATRRNQPPAIWSAIFQQAPLSVNANRVYAGFGDENIRKDIAWNPSLPICLACDWNLNPGMHVELGQYDRLTDTFYVLDEIHGPGMAMNEAARLAAEKIKAIGTLKDRPQLFADATGRSMEDGGSYADAFRQLLANHQISTRDRVPTANPRVLNRVLSVSMAIFNDATGERKLFVHPRCERLIADFRKVEAKSTGEPNKDADSALTHASDALGYWVHYVRPVRMGLPMSANGSKQVVGSSNGAARNGSRQGY